jgi:L-ascorbate metabolism protein UlaG (beta-lactamase superfamily)
VVWAKTPFLKGDALLSRKKALCILIIVLITAVWLGCTLGRGNRSIADPEGNESAGEEYDVQQGRAEDLSAGEIKLEYLGHSSFLLETEGLRFLMDPYAPQVGYGSLEVEADVVTISHEHMDHNYTAAAPEARVIRGLTSDGLGWEDVSFTEGNVNIIGLATYHDESSGKLRGRNTAFVFDVGGIRLVHLGDLGHILGEGDVEKLNPVDILLIPVGGHYTIDAAEAREVVAQLSPSIVIPMHYQTRITQNWPIDTLNTFLEGEKVVKKGEGHALITRDVLPEEREVWVLERRE